MQKQGKAMCYIAGPLFNPEQVKLLEKIELLLEQHGFSYFSPRLHSGSSELSPEEKKDPVLWRSVFESNVVAVNACDFMIAVVDFKLVGNKKLMVIDEDWRDADPPIEIQMPDTGTVWEMGYFWGQAKPLLAFSEKQPDKMNLMLTHSVDGVVCGIGALDKFLSGEYPEGGGDILDTAYGNYDDRITAFVLTEEEVQKRDTTAGYFNWFACSPLVSEVV